MKLFLTTGLVFSGLVLQAQQGVVKGTVKTENGDAVIAAHISIPGLRKGTVTDAQGVFILTAPEGAHQVVISGVGYKTTEQQLHFDEDTTVLELRVAVGNDMKEVVVSASRRAETLDEVPSSITIVSQRELQAQKSISNNIADILSNTVPGLGFSVNQTGNTGQTLRGRNLLVMIDGVPQSTPLRNGGRDIRTIDPSAIERVEVIKGATAIYGNGADGGLINYITKKGDKTKGLSGQTSLGVNTQLRSAQHTGGFSAGQLLSGAYKKLDYVVSGHYEQTGVYKDARGEVLSPEYGLGETQLWNAFAKVGYDLNARNRLELMYNFFGSQQRSDYILKTGKYGETPSTGVLGQRPGAAEGTPYNHNLSLHYSSQRLIGATDLDVNVYMQRFRTVYSWSTTFENGGQSQINSKKQGLRVNLSTPLSFGVNYNLQLQYGLDFMNDLTSQDLVDGRTWVPEMDMKNYAPYAQVKTTFYKHWVLKAGARLENINIGVDDFTTIRTQNRVTGLFEDGIAVKGGDLSYNAFVYNGGLRYNKWRCFSPFVSYSQSFSVMELGRILRTAKQNTVSLLQTKAVIAHNYEAGFSSNLGPVNLEAAYYISTSKLGSSFIEKNGVFEIQRAPEKVYGFEVAADARLLRNLWIGGSYSYVEGKLDGDDNGKYDDGPKDTYLGGDRIAPPKITAYVRYQPIKQWSLRLQMLNAGTRKHFQPVNGIYGYGTGPVEGFTIFSFNSNVTLDKHSTVSVGVENLFNADYYTVNSQWNGRNENYVKGNGARLNLQYTYNF